MKTKVLAILLSFALTTTMSPILALASNEPETSEHAADTILEKTDFKAAETNTAISQAHKRMMQSEAKRARVSGPGINARDIGDIDPWYISVNERYWFEGDEESVCYMAFDIPVGRYATLVTDTFKLDELYFFICDADGNLLYGISANAYDYQKHGYMTLPAGEYLMQIYSSDAASAFFTINTHASSVSNATYEKEINELDAEGTKAVPDVATPIAIDKPFCGSYYNYFGDADLDFYEVVIPEADGYKVRLRTNKVMGLEFYDETGNSLGSLSTRAASSKVDTWLDLGQLDPGTYYLLVGSSSKAAIGSTYSGGIYSSRNIIGAKVTLGTSSYVYNGNAKRPSVAVKLNGAALNKAADYSVTYKNNTRVGKATVTVTGKGNYFGTVTKTFTIKPKATSVTSLVRLNNGFKVKWATRTAQTSGYQLAYKRVNTSKWYTKTVAGYKTNIKSVTGLKDKKSYQVKVRTYKTVDGVKYYSSWSAVRTVRTK